MKEWVFALSKKIFFTPYLSPDLVGSFSGLSRDSIGSFSGLESITMAILKYYESMP